MKQIFILPVLVLIIKTHLLQACFSYEPFSIHIHKCGCDCDSSYDDKYILHHIQDNYGSGDCGYSEQPTTITCGCSTQPSTSTYGCSSQTSCGCSRQPISSGCGCSKAEPMTCGCKKQPTSTTCDCSTQPLTSSCSCTNDNYNYQYGNSYYQNRKDSCGCSKQLYHQENCQKTPSITECGCLSKQQAQYVPLNGVSQYAASAYDYQSIPSYNSQGYGYNNQGYNNNNYGYSYNNENCNRGAQPYGYDSKVYYNSGDVKKCSFSAVVDGDMIVAEPRDSFCNGYNYRYY